MKYAVIGAGSWGTALANVLAENGHEVRLLARREAVARAINTTHENPDYVQGQKLHEGLVAETDAGRALEGAEKYLFVTPSQKFRETLKELKPLLPESPAILCASKGIELGTLSLMSGVVSEALDGLNPRYGILSGPSFAREVLQRCPTAVTIASHDEALAKGFQEDFSNEYFRVYTSTDVTGVELGGAVKNVVAIAVGICDGLRFGTNARAALITRGLAEMGRLYEAMDAEKSTLPGLSGMGDLVLTCTGDLSRNRQVGLRIGAGETLEQISGSMHMVAEGVKTAKSVFELGQKLGVDLPITAQVNQVLHHGKNPVQAVRELMTRSLKAE